MEYTLASPLTVGDLRNPTTVTKLRLVSISINFEPFYADQGTAVLSVVLTDGNNSYRTNVVYQDASALAFWQQHSATLEADVFSKLIADGKLPAGTLSAPADSSTTSSTTQSAT